LVPSWCAQKPSGRLRVWMLTWTKSRAAALIASIGGLDGHRRDVI
jgi:hypothetical protein